METAEPETGNATPAPDPIVDTQTEVEAARFANAAAAMKCMRPGGGAGAPRRDELAAFMREHR